MHEVTARTRARPNVNGRLVVAVPAPKRGVRLHSKEDNMPQVSRMFFKAAVIFLILSVAAGLQMSISGEHNVTGAHAHASLLGWVTGAIFGTYFALVPEKAESVLAYVLFWLFSGSVAIMSAALYFLLLGNFALAPVVAVASIAVFAAVILFAFVVFARVPASLPSGRHSITG
jgi:hypothetical protein